VLIIYWTLFKQEELQALPHQHLVDRKVAHPVNQALELQAQETQVSLDMHLSVYKMGVNIKTARLLENARNIKIIESLKLII
jgi:hypothetical protein